MARRSSSALLASALCIAAACLLASAVLPAFVAPPAAPRGGEAASVGAERTAQAAALGAALAAVPSVAHAATSSYALLQLGWAVFIVGLGPAVLFWIYFNRPELL
mmetsp:Transcript_17537/g.55222  ORF Transcript_17537/g.55222 Transcript_17537/m.55222 type:complete len:105 (+) Transcript_17537:87-401(+)|eukprot:CAMPEP_0204529600 /NCGR_PEP_ID=MMETSP0661-20131031/10142_1 /ASSEMBLY_ACC=CAM_ASM_000606 /TAXON_ID=109239 /ORGANISM="Alexandrium margalefi, Strain AMGDE01CS-322" /LENGTH=104 /DNA_ID=CAMNT_0051535633 /DNA_START=192 /DNA_END=506 /DNA_ORIENTATION=+